MSLQNFGVILKKIRPHAKIITLHNWAEPFLNPEIAQMVKLLNKEAPDAFVHISSNGVTLSQERMNKLSGARIDLLEISISGLTQDIYEKYHKNGHIKRVFNNIGLLIKNREIEIKKLSIKYLQFEYNVVSYFTLKNEILKNLGLERLPSFVELNIVPGYITASVSGFEEKYSIDLDKNTKKTLMKQTCNFLFEQLVIRSDGEIFPCCVVPYQQSYSLGNLLAMEFDEFFSSPRYVSSRKSFLEGTNQACNSCYVITKWQPVPFDRFLVKSFNRLTIKLLNLLRK